MPISDCATGRPTRLPLLLIFSLGAGIMGQHSLKHLLTAAIMINHSCQPLDSALPLRNTKLGASCLPATGASLHCLWQTYGYEYTYICCSSMESTMLHDIGNLDDPV
ncbi:hypothetical protein V8F33_009586 [Rhypophila sp. PSN 637]